MKAMLVYGAGTAWVFAVQALTCGTRDRGAVLLCRGLFSECECFARGMVAAGATVRSARFTEESDPQDRPWSWDVLLSSRWPNIHPVDDGPELLSDAKERNTFIANLAMRRKGTHANRT